MKRLLYLAVLIPAGISVYLAFRGSSEIAAAYRVRQRLERIEADTGSTDMYFTYMKRINPDLEALLYWEGMLDLPAVQGVDNTYYLSHAFDGSRYSGGCAFIDAASSMDDAGVVIYGHHVFEDENAVFSPLMKLADSVPADRTIVLICEGRVCEYEYLSSFITGDDTIMDLSLARKGPFDESTLRSLQALLGCTLTSSDRLLFLQTCVKEDGSLKLIAAARLTGVRAD